MQGLLDVAVLMLFGLIELKEKKVKGHKDRTQTDSHYLNLLGKDGLNSIKSLDIKPSSLG